MDVQDTLHNVFASLQCHTHDHAVTTDMEVTGAVCAHVHSEACV